MSDNKRLVQWKPITIEKMGGVLTQTARSVDQRLAH